VCICSYEGANDDSDDNDSYVKRCLPLRNTRVHFSGTVSAVPVPKGVDSWANTWVPRVGKWTSIQGDIVGEYAFDGQQSLCVLVQNFTPAPSSSPTETTTEALTEPSGTGSVQSTPRYSDDYILHIVTYTLTNLILL
jgi:hypothetical protein